MDDYRNADSDVEDPGVGIAVDDGISCVIADDHYVLAQGDLASG